MKRWAAVFLLLQLPAASSLAEPVPANFDALLAAFARMPGLEARFVEEKSLALLARPLESRGRLYFTRPGLLLRKVEEPSPSEVLITSSELRVKSAAGVQTIDLRSRPDVRPFVESLTWLLAGNGKALANVYTIVFVPIDKSNWHVTLTPKAEPITRLIASIEIAGDGLRVREIRVRETSGDETLTRIVEANPERRFQPAELRALFGVGTRK